MKGEEQVHNKKLKSSDGPSHIPHDLLVQILTRLPIKSFAKLQFVSKTWYSKIRSKDFFKSFSTPSSQLLISFRNTTSANPNAEKSLFLFTSSQENDSLLSNLDMRMGSMDDYIYTRCSSVNGFICLSHKGQFMICNPITAQVITLPEIADPTWKLRSKYLGYDPIDKQYKAMCKRLSQSADDQEHMILTLGGDKKPLWRRIEGATQNYYPLSKDICINGVVYYGALTSNMERVVVCFDVRSERLSFVTPPWDINQLNSDGDLNFINYKGKLANVSIKNCIYRSLQVIVWVLQDVNKHQWSMETHSVSTCWLDYSEKVPGMCVHGINKNGEFIFAPKYLPRRTEPFYIVYYHEYSKNVRKVELQGIADDEEFRRSYGIENNGNCQVYISPDYAANYTFL